MTAGVAKGSKDGSYAITPYFLHHRDGTKIATSTSMRVGRLRFITWPQKHFSKDPNTQLLLTLIDSSALGIGRAKKALASAAGTAALFSFRTSFSWSS